MKKPDRPSFAGARRIVVKIGSRALVRRDGHLDPRRIASLVHSIAALHAEGREVLLVTSGAIAVGLQALGYRRRPTDLPSLQMAAAVGQSRLMSTYADLFARHRILAGQVLLTHDDLRDRRRHLNALATFRKLLERRVVPVINENDAVSCEEIRFGDNDALGSRIAILLEADLLVFLSTVDGFYAPSPSGRNRRVSCLPVPGPADLAAAKGKGSPFSTGGMASKLQSAIEATRTGIPVVIANGRKDGILARILAGDDVGTLLPPAPPAAADAPTRRRLWVAYFHHPHGRLVVDSGAADALRAKGKSLLPVGLRAVEGDFVAGDLVRVLDPSGAEIARGLAEHSAAELRLLLGRPSRAIRDLLGPDAPPEAIHRDNLVLL